MCVYGQPYVCDDCVGSNWVFGISGVYVTYVLRYVSAITSSMRGKWGLATHHIQAYLHAQHRRTTAYTGILWTQTRQPTNAARKRLLCPFTSLYGGVRG